MAMKELQDFPKIPGELMERLMNLTLQYFEERSRVSCMYHIETFISYSATYGGNLTKKVATIG